MRPTLVPLLALAAALPGCIQSEPVEPASLPPFEGLLVVPSNATSVEFQGEVSSPSTLLPGSVDEQRLDVPPEALLVRLNLTWTTPAPFGGHLDLVVVDADGEAIGSAFGGPGYAATSVRVTPKAPPGAWTLQVISHNHPGTAYTLAAEVVA